MISVDEDPSPGVNLVGFLEAESGLGEIARRLTRSIERAGIPYAPIAYRRTPSRQQHAFARTTSELASFDTNVICINANELPGLADEMGPGLFANRYSIGVWFWETNVFRRADRDAFLYLDEVWAPSAYVQAAIERAADIPVRVVPIPVEAPAPPVLSREELGLPEGFVFLFLFDFVSAERKNPFDVVRAFNRAFAPGEGPTLVLKSINGRERKPRLLAELESAAAERPDILVRDGYVSVVERDALLSRCDCFISLHRSEGFGLPMAEAMAVGKPVIATGYSGNLDFMDQQTSYLVRYRLVPVPASWWAYEPGAEWAEPDIEDAAAAMRRLWQHPDDGARLGVKARQHILRAMSLSRTADFLMRRLADARARGALAARKSGKDARPHMIDVSRSFAEGLGNALTAGPRLHPMSLLRRSLRRALWPQLEEDRRVGIATLDALVALHRSVHELEMRMQRWEERSSRNDAHRVEESDPGQV